MLQTLSCFHVTMLYLLIDWTDGRRSWDVCSLNSREPPPEPRSAIDIESLAHSAARYIKPLRELSIRAGGYLTEQRARWEVIRATGRDQDSLSLVRLPRNVENAVLDESDLSAQ